LSTAVNYRSAAQQVGGWRTIHEKHKKSSEANQAAINSASAAYM
jgi:hypothetical protein